LSVRLIDYLKG